MCSSSFVYASCVAAVFIKHITLTIDDNAIVSFASKSLAVSCIPKGKGIEWLLFIFILLSDVNSIWSWDWVSWGHITSFKFSVWHLQWAPLQGASIPQTQSFSVASTITSSVTKSQVELDVKCQQCLPITISTRETTNRWKPRYLAVQDASKSQTQTVSSMSTPSATMSQVTRESMLLSCLSRRTHTHVTVHSSPYIRRPWPFLCRVLQNLKLRR